MADAANQVAERCNNLINFHRVAGEKAQEIHQVIAGIPDSEERQTFEDQLRDLLDHQAIASSLCASYEVINKSLHLQYDVDGLHAKINSTFTGKNDRERHSEDVEAMRQLDALTGAQGGDSLQGEVDYLRDRLIEVSSSSRGSVLLPGEFDEHLKAVHGQLNHHAGIIKSYVEELGEEIKRRGARE